VPKGAFFADDKLDFLRRCRVQRQKFSGAHAHAVVAEHEECVARIALTAPSLARRAHGPGGIAVLRDDQLELGMVGHLKATWYVIRVSFAYSFHSQYKVSSLSTVVAQS